MLKKETISLIVISCSIDNELDVASLFLKSVFFFIRIRKERITLRRKCIQCERRKVCIVFVFIIFKESITRSISQFQQLSQPTNN